MGCDAGVTHRVGDKHEVFKLSLIVVAILQVKRSTQSCY